MDEIVIGISGISASDNPGPGIGVARSLKEDEELKTRLIGLAYDALEPGIYMDWLFEKSFILPYPSANAEAFIDRLLYIQNQCGLDFIVPCLDAELPLFIKYGEELAEQGIRTFVPTMPQFRLRAKEKLNEIAEKIEIELPKTEVVASADELVAAVDRIGLPVMVKGTYYQAYKANTTQEALHHYHKIVAEWGYPLIVQEVITGDELNVVGLGDGEGQALGLVGLKKVCLSSLGKVWAGTTVHNDQMLASAGRFVEKYQWRGPFELECIIRDETVYLIEVNPRFPAWSYLATGVGVNLPAKMLRRCFELPVEPSDGYDAGKLFVRYSYEMVTEMGPFQKIVTSGETP